MRFIYADEAGTDADQPVLVVVGVIIHADQQWLPALAEIQRIVQTVPARYRAMGNFISHAKTIWGSKEFRQDEWADREARTQFLCEMMSIPRKLGLPLAVSFMRKELVPLKDIVNHFTGERVPGVDAQHVRVFTHCISAADGWMQKFAKPEEVAVLVAEDVPEKRAAIRNAVDHLKRFGTMSASPPRKETEAHRKAGMRLISPISIRKVVDTVHFVEKQQGPLVQIADACAFGLRRFYSKQSYGERFARSIFEPDISLEVVDEGLPYDWSVFVFSGNNAPGGIPTA